MAAAKEGWENPQVAQMYALAELASGPFARLMLEQSGIGAHSGSSLVVFDNACGTGAVVAQLYDLLSSDKEARSLGDLKVTCGDTSESMILYLQDRIKKEGWTGTTAKIIDGMDTQLPSETYTHAYSTFGIGHMPDPLVALADMHRILVPGGSIGLAFWHRIDWFRFVREALDELPGPPKNPTVEQFMGAIHKGDWFTTEYTTEKLVGAGFENVKCVVQKRLITCGTPKQFVTMLYMPLTLIAQVFWTEEDREKCQQLAAGAVEKHLVEIFGADGEVRCDSEAVIATGTKK